MKKRILFASITTLCIFIFSSCKHESVLPVIEDSTIPANICFQDEVLPIIQSNCAFSGCHVPGDEEPDLSNYNEIKRLVKPGDPENSKLYKYASGSEMPPAPRTPLNLQQVTYIYGWIKQGALDNTCACDSNVFTFNAAILPIIQRNCLGCHGAGSNKPLINYQNIKDNADAIYGDITYANNPMPKPPTAKLSDCKILQIKKWINNGKLNN